MKNDKNRLEKMEKNLYSRNFKEPDFTRRSDLDRPELETQDKWASDDSSEISNLINRQKKEHEEGHLFKRILIGSVIFLLISLVIAGYMFFGGGNRISSSNIDIQILGPLSVAGGEELKFEVIVKNENNSDLEGASLQIEYPEGTRVPGQITQELLRHREPLGNIQAGGEVRKEVSAVLFGEKDSIKEITLTLEYRLKGSSALFFKDKKYEIALGSSPVIVTINYPKEVTSGQDMEFVVDITSNTGETLNNLLLRTEFPFGFSFSSSNPEPVTNGIWRIGDLASGDRRSIRIKGSLQGQNEEERTFRFAVGIERDGFQNQIAADFVSLSESITIKRPFLDLAVSIAGSSVQEYSARPGERMQVNIVWTNNLSVPVLDAEIQAKISGGSFDRGSLMVPASGFYRSVDNTVVWEKATNREFSRIEPGQKGVVGFSFSSLVNPSSSLSNQEILIDISMKGEQVVSGGTPQVITSTANRLVKLSSNLSVAPRIVRTIGQFENSGPFPPLADRETTYTVIWTVSNSLNNITDTRVRATLPTYVSWAELSSPSSERISYNPSSREVVWVLGDVQAGTAFTSSPREASFQIKFLPSLNQVGTSPILLNETKISGNDSFVGKPIEFNRPALTTRINTDPAYRSGDEIVGN